MQEIKLNLTTDQNVITILQGDAAKPIEQGKVKVNGNIAAVYDYLQQRIKFLKPNESHIVVDKEKGTITLTENEGSTIEKTIVAKTSTNERLSSLGINTDKKYTAKELVKMFKFNKFLFDSPQEVDNLIARVNSLTVKTNTVVKQTQADKGGNSGFVYEKNTDIELPNLLMNCEIYSGDEKKTFTVEIWGTATDASVLFWLESTELNVLEVTTSDSIIDEIVDKIKKIESFSLPIITA